MGKIGKKAMGLVAAVATMAFCALGFVWFDQANGHEGPPQADMIVDAATRNEVIEAAIAELNGHYVFPEKAAEIERHLRAQVQQGAYDAVTSAEEFAQTLTHDLQALTQDGHLSVRYFEQAVTEPAPGQEESPEEAAEELFRQMRLNFGFESVARLHGNIGYIDLHAFARPQYAGERLVATMDLLADTKALIIDLRKCGGGDPDTVKLFASYLFDERTHLNDIYWRDENRTEERWTQDSVPGKKYGAARKLYLLTSADTFSGGEDFAYALKNNGRATLVGETTGGGANAGGPSRLSAHFMMFVPSGRPISPVTHSNWEGIGVTPDIQVDADDALEVAHLAVIKNLIATETDPRWAPILEQTRSELE